MPMATHIRPQSRISLTHMIIHEAVGDFVRHTKIQSSPSHLASGIKPVFRYGYNTHPIDYMCEEIFHLLDGRVMAAVLSRKSVEKNIWATVSIDNLHLQEVTNKDRYTVYLYTSYSKSKSYYGSIDLDAARRFAHSDSPTRHNTAKRYWSALSTACATRK